ncbi:MAG: 4-hydroxythreonine-4-phosphate dehydrogenase PdxA [bacterium]
MNKPVIGITMGDPAGIGPEVIVKTLLKSNIGKLCIPLIIGGKRFIEKEILNLCRGTKFCAPTINVVNRIEGTKDEAGVINIFDLHNADPRKIPIGRVSASAGKAAVEYIDKAVELVKSGGIQAIVTAPINKEAVHLAGLKFPGHTEYLAHLINTKHFAMMLAGGNLRVVLVTTHLAIKYVAKSLNIENVYWTIFVTYKSLQNRFGIKRPKVAVCSLNPHGGEGGLFGDEEKRIIIPAIKKIEKQDIKVDGPLPSDTLFVKANKGLYDAVVCMYHDQALIPLKMASFGKAVNITLGLPFVRTSVDHGTAFDIAGKGVADTGSMEEAIKLATEIVKSIEHGEREFPLTIEH